MWQMVFDSLQQLTDVQNFGIAGVADWVLEKWTTDSTPIQNDLAKLQSAEEMSERCSDFTKRKFPGFKWSKGATEYLQRYSDMATLGLESSKQELERGTRMEVYAEKEAQIQEDRNEFFSQMRPSAPVFETVCLLGSLQFN